MTTDDALTSLSSWTDDEIAQDNVRATGVLYAAAALEELKLIELVDRLNELNQNKLLSIGAGEASNLLHEFWNNGFQPPAAAPPRRALRARPRRAGRRGRRRRAQQRLPRPLLEPRHGARRALRRGRPSGRRAARQPRRAHRRGRARRPPSSCARRSPTRRGAVGPRAANGLPRRRHVGARRERHAGAQRRRRARRAGHADPRDAGATILRALPQLCEDPAPSDEVVAAAKQWLPANSPA